MGRDSKRWIAHIASSNIAEITDVNQVLDEDGYNDGYIIPAVNTWRLVTRRMFIFCAKCLWGSRME